MQSEEHRSWIQSSSPFLPLCEPVLRVLARHCIREMSWLPPLPTPSALMLVAHVMQGSGSAVMTGGSGAQLALQLVCMVWLHQVVDSCELI